MRIPGVGGSIFFLSRDQATKRPSDQGGEEEVKEEEERMRKEKLRSSSAPAVPATRALPPHVPVEWGLCVLVQHVLGHEVPELARGHRIHDSALVERLREGTRSTRPRGSAREDSSPATVA